jgi:hypothetical protein
VHENGLEPETWAQRTGGGGRQLFWTAPEGWTPPTFKASGLGVDVRGQGGFVMAPPSMHASGQIYDWESGRAPWNCELAVAPPWLCEAIEKLRVEAGGGPTGGHERVASTDAKNAFGLDVDDREHKLQTVVWAAVVDLYRASPIPPPQAVQDAEVARIWTQYEVTTKSRLEARPNASGGWLTNADLLELEGRGLTLLRQKWTYAIGRWDSKVAEAAKVPKPEDVNGWGAALNESLPPDSTLDEPDDAPVSAGLFSDTPPDREWIVPGWIAHGEVNSLYGGGATGKSLLAFQLCYSCAIGALWLGLETRRGSSLFVSCEDDWDELNRREVKIRAAMGVVLRAQIAGVHVWDRYGRENLLVAADVAGRLHPTNFLERVRLQVERLKPDLLILDTLADMFGGNEIDRAQVNGFVKTFLGGVIREQKATGHKLAVLILAHPSVSGQTSGSGLSGSTAWDNAVRSRLYLTKDQDGSSDVRTLSRSKANYTGGDDGTLALIWQDGWFSRLGESDAVRLAMGTIKREVGQAYEFGEPFMDRADHAKYLQRALPKFLAKAPNPYAPEVIQEALHRLIQDRLIRRATGKELRGWRPMEGARP